MTRPSKLRDLEAQYNQPMRLLLPRMANELGSLSAVAEHWRVNLTTLEKWRKRLGVTNEWQPGPERNPDGC